jgi:hypothetical protein
MNAIDLGIKGERGGTIAVIGTTTNFSKLSKVSPFKSYKEFMTFLKSMSKSKTYKLYLLNTISCSREQLILKLSKLVAKDGIVDYLVIGEEAGEILKDSMNGRTTEVKVVQIENPAGLTWGKPDNIKSLTKSLASAIFY